MKKQTKLVKQTKLIKRIKAAISTPPLAGKISKILNPPTKRAKTTTTVKRQAVIIPAVAPAAVVPRVGARRLVKNVVVPQAGTRRAVKDVVVPQAGTPRIVAHVQLPAGQHPNDFFPPEKIHQGIFGTPNKSKYV